MNQKASLVWGSIIAGAAVAIGAFGAHALKPMLIAAGRQETFEIAVRYQFYHALALLIVGLLARDIQTKGLGTSAWLFLIGILIFSGSLYVLCLTGITWLGAITPIGGVFFLGGWTFLALAVARHRF
jgi:uncharacterized membrane protein YgdD (TMEM256/DUF423 family)